jgi:hypothetical protein
METVDFSSTQADSRYGKIKRIKAKLDNDKKPSSVKPKHITAEFTKNQVQRSFCD